MKRDKKCPVLSKASPESEIYQSVTPGEAGWNYLSFLARTVKSGQKWTGNTEGNEYLFVLLGGNFLAETSAGTWKTWNGRKDVFSGLPHALYLPPDTEFEISPAGEILDIACGWCTSGKKYPARLISPADVVQMGIELRGGDNASRQINSILPPGSESSRLVCVEVYTPSGNWSSFPAHKHDTRKTEPATGKLLEASLEEIYSIKLINHRDLRFRRFIMMTAVWMNWQRRIATIW